MVSERVERNNIHEMILRANNNDLIITVIIIYDVTSATKGITDEVVYLMMTGQWASEV